MVFVPQHSGIFLGWCTTVAKEFQMQNCCRVRPHNLCLERADIFLIASKRIHHRKWVSKWLLEQMEGTTDYTLFYLSGFKGLGKHEIKLSEA